METVNIRYKEDVYENDKCYLIRKTLKSLTRLLAYKPYVYRRTN